MAPAWEHHRCSGHQQPLHLSRQGQLTGGLPPADPPHTREVWVGERARWSPYLHPSPPPPVSCCCRSWISLQRWISSDSTLGIDTTWIQLRGKKSSSKIKDGLSFFNLTSHLIYFSHADTWRRKWTLCIYATRGLLHEYHDVAALCTVKKGAHWT